MADLESFLPYDTTAMRSIAAALHAQAGRLGAIGDEISGAAGSLVFDGPAGDRIRSSLGGASRSETDVAGRLVGMAGRVLSAAAQVDADNAAIRAHNDAVLHAMPPVERKLVENNL